MPRSMVLLSFPRRKKRKKIIITSKKVTYAKVFVCSMFSSAEEVKDAIVKNITWQMNADRKIGALKSFQGYMWKEGYESGELRGV